MKKSLIGSVVNTVTGTVESTTNTLTGNTSTSSDDSVSPTRSPTTTTSAPTLTTSTAKATTATPVSTTPTPTSTTSTPTATTAPSTGPSTSVSDTASSASSSSSISESTFSLTTAPPSSTTVLPRATENYHNTSMSMSDSSSSSTQIRGSHSYVSVSIGSRTGSSSQGDGETGATDVASTGLNNGTIVGLALGALGTLILLGLLLSWCLRRRRRQLLCSIRHVRLGSTGNLPLFNTRGTERFETSSTSVSFGPFHTARLNSDHDSTSGVGRSGLWEDEVITVMRIPLEKLTTTKLLSSGGYGEVYHGIYRDEAVAIKVLLPEKQKDLEQINAFLAEIKMMATIDHPCIVRFLGVAWDSLSDLSAVMEFVEGGDLRALLDRFQQEQQPRGFNQVKARIALQTVQALTYLHSLDPTVLHRDFKSRNILLTSELEAKLSDFGVARKYSYTSTTAAVGTSLWMAPEVMLGDRYDASADIFSFGVVLSELDSHRYPYAEARMTNSGQRVPDAALLQLVAMGRVSVNFSRNAPTELVDLGCACVSLNPTTRPSASEVHYRLQLILQSYEIYTPYIQR